MMKNITRDFINVSFLPKVKTPPVEWRISEGLTQYTDAINLMEQRIVDIRQGRANELVWLVEHPSIYTAGTSAKQKDLLNGENFPVYVTGRGGEYTYHGPGQRVAYVMLDLKRRQEDARAFIAALEKWIILTLATFNVKGERREDRVGVWVVRPDKHPGPDGRPAECKIAAIGIRLKKWVSYHGIAINVEPNLEHYGGIVPCGIADHGVTSLVDLGLPITLIDFDLALRSSFEIVFGPSTD